MAEFTGVVGQVFNRGEMWSLKIGEEWYGCGRDQPQVQDGQTVTLEYKENTKGDRTYKNVIKNTIKVVSGATSEAASSSNSVSSRDVSIQYQSSRKDALAILPLLIENAAVPIQSKSGDKYDAILAVVVELTNKFYLDLQVVVENGGVEVEDMVPTPDDL